MDCNETFSKLFSWICCKIRDNQRRGGETGGGGAYALDPHFYNSNFALISLSNTISIGSIVKVNR